MTKLLPVTYVLVDTWMLTVNLVYKLKNVSKDLKCTTKTHVTISMVLEDLFLLLRFFYPIHPYFYPSTTVFTHPNDGWTGLCTKLCL